MPLKPLLFHLFRGQDSDVSYPDRDEEGNHVCECEEGLAGGDGGGGVDDGLPQGLVVEPMALVAVRPLVLLRPVAVVTPGPVFVPAQKAQSVPGAGASQDPSRRSRPLQARLGEASALRGSRLGAVTFSTALEYAAAFAVRILDTWAERRHQQQPNPEREKLLLAGHEISTLKNAPTRALNHNYSFHYSLSASFFFVLHILTCFLTSVSSAASEAFDFAHLKSHCPLHKHNRCPEQSTQPTLGLTRR